MTGFFLVSGAINIHMGRPQIPSHPTTDIEAWRDAQLDMRRDWRKRKNNEAVFREAKNWCVKYSCPWNTGIGAGRMELDKGLNEGLDGLYLSMEQSNNVLFPNGGEKARAEYKIAIVACFVKSLTDVGKSCCRTGAIVNAVLDFIQDKVKGDEEENKGKSKQEKLADQKERMEKIIDGWYEYEQEAELSAMKDKCACDEPPEEIKKYQKEWEQVFANRHGIQYDKHDHKQRFPFYKKSSLEEKEDYTYYFYYMCYQYEPDETFKRHVDRTIELFAKWPYFDYPEVCPAGGAVNGIATETWQKYAGYLVSTWLTTTKLFAGDDGFKTDQHHIQMEYCKGELPYGPWDFVSQSV